MEGDSELVVVPGLADKGLVGPLEVEGDESLEEVALVEEGADHDVEELRVRVRGEEGLQGVVVEIGPAVETVLVSHRNSDSRGH